MAILRDPRNGRVRGFLRDMADPAAVQAAAASVDAAGPGAGPGLEVVFSRGLGCSGVAKMSGEQRSTPR